MAETTALSCADCGKRMYRAKGSLPQGQGRCHSCRRDRPVRRPRLPDLPCAVCGKMMWRSQTSLPEGQARCLPCRRASRVSPPPGACVVCAAEFPYRKSKRYCSGRCRTAARDARIPGRVRHSEEGWRTRRALKMGAKSEPYTREHIAKRDGYRCRLCGGSVKMRLPYPDPMSPSIDHVVPLSLGGDDTKANVQLAHLRCNLSKNNRPHNEQLALFG